MSSDRISVAVYGTFQDGKSTLINCLTNSDIALVGGDGVSVTHTNTRYTFGYSDKIVVVDKLGTRREVDKLQYLTTNRSIEAEEIIIESKFPILKYFDIIDTPGFDANEHDSKMAEAVLKKTDLAILLLRNKGISEQNKFIASQLIGHNIPYVCVMNCFDDNLDNWNPCAEQNENIKKDILAELNMFSCKPMSNLKVKPIYVVNLMWFWLSLGLKSQNRSIQLKEKIVRKYWDEIIGDTNYSATGLKHASMIESFLKVFKNRKLRTYLIALKEFKMSNHLCKSHVFKTVRDLEERKNKLITFLKSI